MTATVEKLDPPCGRCEGIYPDTKAHIYCDGGPGLWVTRRARWERRGYGQCGTCRRTQDRMERGDSMTATVEQIAKAHPNYSTGAGGPYCQGCGEPIPAPGGNYTLGWTQHVVAATVAAQGAAAPTVTAEQRDAAVMILCTAGVGPAAAVADQILAVLGIEVTR